MDQRVYNRAGHKRYLYNQQRVYFYSNMTDNNPLMILPRSLGTSLTNTFLIYSCSGLTSVEVTMDSTSDQSEHSATVAVVHFKEIQNVIDDLDKKMQGRNKIDLG